MSVSDDIHAIPRLIGDAMEQLGKLVQNEAQLARAELMGKLKQAGIGAAFLLAAAVFAIPVLVMVLMALALWLTASFGMSPAAAYLISAAAGSVFAVILALIGKSYLKPENLAPKVTMRQLDRDLQTAKELAK